MQVVFARYLINLIKKAALFSFPSVSLSLFDFTALLLSVMRRKHSELYTEGSHTQPVPDSILTLSHAWSLYLIKTHKFAQSNRREVSKIDLFYFEEEI